MIKVLQIQTRDCKFSELYIFTSICLHVSSSVGLSMVGAIAGIVSALAGPAAPIIMPIAGCFVLAKWAYDVYQQS